MAAHIVKSTDMQATKLLAPGERCLQASPLKLVGNIYPAVKDLFSSNTGLNARLYVWHSTGQTMGDIRHHNRGACRDHVN